MIAPWKNDRVRAAYRRPEIRASLEIILSVFTVVFLLLVVIRPTLTIVAELQKKIIDQDSVDKKLSTKITQLSKARNDLSTFGNQIDLFNKAVPDDNNSSGLAKRLALLVQENNLQTNYLTVGSVPLFGNLINLGNKESKTKGEDPNLVPLEKGTNVAKLEVTFDLRGSQTNVLKFLSDIEKLDRLIKLTSVDIKREEEKDSDVTKSFRGVRLIGKGSVYYLPPPKI